VATRFYLPSTGAADVTPTAPAGWSETTGFDILKCVTTKISSAMTSKTRVTSLTAAGTRCLLRQYVSNPIAAQTISGTIKGTVLALESAVNDNIDVVSSRIWVSSPDGLTNRGTLLAIGDYGPVAEFNTALRAKRIADGDSITSVTALGGDRIIIELGYGFTTIGTSVSGSLSFGDDSATDLGDNETDTAANNPFVEFSQTLVFHAGFVGFNNYLSLKVGAGLSTGERIR